MIIQTLDKGYTVIKYCEAGTRYERYICRDAERDAKCTIIRIKDKNLIQNITEYYGEKLKDKKFRDLQDCFVSEELLHLVFVYNEGITLEEKLANEVCVLENRLVIGKKILERMVMLDMPPYFQCDALKIGNIIMKSDTDIVSNHTLEDVEHFRKYTLNDVCKVLITVIERLFAKELKKHLIPELNEFRNALKRGTIVTYLELIEAYNKVMEAYETMTPEEIAMPKTRSFRIWKGLRKGLKPLRKLLAVLLMLCAVAYLCFAVKEYIEPAKGQESIDSIGTLEIKGDTQ